MDDTIPKELEQICLQALVKEPSQRYTTAKDLADDLRRFLAVEPNGEKPDRFKLVRWGLVVLLLAASALVVWWLLRPTWPPAEQQLVQSIQRKGKPRPLVPGGPADLADCTRLRKEDRLRFVCDLPRGYWPAAFYLDSAGDLTKLDLQVSKEEHFDRAQGTWVVKGPPGTALVLLCAGRRDTPALDQVKEVLAAAAQGEEAWPELPAQTVLLRRRDGVKPVVPRGVRGPEGPDFTRAHDRLERLRQALKNRSWYFAGVALLQD